jgi:hypothetical protein
MVFYPRRNEMIVTFRAFTMAVSTGMGSIRPMITLLGVVQEPMAILASLSVRKKPIVSRRFFLPFLFVTDAHALILLLCCFSARLKGTEKNATSFSSGNHDYNQSSSRAITVLQRSSQCRALVEFHRSILFATTTATTAAP